MRFLIKVLGACCFIAAALSVLLLIALLPDTTAVLLFGAAAIAFCFGGITLFKKAKTEKQKIAPIAQHTEPDPEPQSVKKSNFVFGVAGVYYRQKEIMRDLMDESYEYGLTKKEILEEGLDDTRIYKYDIVNTAASLVPEPDNPHDPNAIKVIVGDVLVGYVPAEKTARVRNILERKEIIKTICQIYGGEYKYLADKDSSIEYDSTGLKASVEIQYK